jgi:hypothetical protein
MSKSQTPQSRLITSFQSTGRVGKSTIHQALISWLSHAEIPFMAIDADGTHKTLNRWYPEHSTLSPFAQPDDLQPILNAVGQAPVTLLDFPAQQTPAILTAFEHFHTFHVLREKHVRLTNLIFASDERAAMESAAAIVQTCGDFADYVIVKNPARFTSQVFDESPWLRKTLLDSAKAPTINFPRITGWTIEYVDKLSKQQHKSLTFREAEPLIAHDAITSKFELEHWRNLAFAQFEDAATHLLPSPDMIKKRIERPKQKAVATIDPFDL